MMQLLSPVWRTIGLKEEEPENIQRVLPCLVKKGLKRAILSLVYRDIYIYIRGSAKYSCYHSLQIRLRYSCPHNQSYAYQCYIVIYIYSSHSLLKLVYVAAYQLVYVAAYQCYIVIYIALKLVYSNSLSYQSIVILCQISLLKLVYVAAYQLPYVAAYSSQISLQ